MADLVGQQIGPYRLIRLLGRGGFADVYLGEHSLLGRQVAIKMFDVYRWEKAQEQFSAETQIIARLNHPHIERILDFGVVDNWLYRATEYAPGGTLRNRHPKGGILPLATVISYVSQVAEALQYAHEQHLIHRDIKPENMLIRADGTILLSDFGIATVAHTTTTMSGALVGAVSYMAPEQLQGNPRAASDQYALAVVTYEWLTGKRPFQGSFMEVALQHVSTPPPSLREQVPTLPVEVEQVVFKALAKDPRERFATVQAFAKALQQAAGQQASSIISPSRRQRVATGQALKNLRERIGLSQSELAERIGVVPIIVSYWERGVLTPRRESLPLLAKVLSIPLTELDAIFAEPPDDLEGYEVSLWQTSGDLGSVSHMEESRKGSRRFRFTPAPSNFSRFSGHIPTIKERFFSLFSALGRRRTQQVQHSLFALAHTTLDDDEIAFVGEIYTAQAGIAQHKPKGFRGLPFTVTTHSISELISFDISCHVSDNVELLGHWQQDLAYDPRQPVGPFVTFHFKIIHPGKSSIIIDFYRERHLLQTIQLAFEAMERTSVAVVSTEKG